jgi:urease accessory protein UreF
MRGHAKENSSGAQYCLGDVRILGERLGSPQDILEFRDFNNLAGTSIHTPASLEKFLVRYRDQILIPIELPAIALAYAHTLRNEARELIALDRSLIGEAALQPFASASGRVGRSHLKRLRSLRDHRVVQRYIRALDTKRAFGWHSLVYGMTLAIYSVALRQGLLGYAQQTLNGFLESGGKSISLSESDSSKLLHSVASPLSASVEQAIFPKLEARLKII